MSSLSASRRATTDGAAVEDKIPEGFELKNSEISADDEEMPTRDVPVSRPHPPGRLPITPLRPGASVLNIEDNLRQKSEIKILRAQLRQTQNEYRNEQENVMQLKRRLNSLEKSRLDESVKVNLEAVCLQTQAAKLHCQVERVEADRQSLEFTIAKVKRDVINERKIMSEKEARLVAQVDALRDQVKTLDRHVQELGHQVQLQKQTIADQTDHLQTMTEDKKKEQDVHKLELEFVASERNRLETMIQEKELVMGDMSEKLQEYEDQIHRQSEIIRKQLTELGLCLEREEATNERLEVAEQKLRMVEESVEAERAAHLESKFNSEVVQLKVKDLEGALETEKTTKTETSVNYDTLSKQYSEMVGHYEALKSHADTVQQQHKRLSAEYDSVRAQLSRELEEKTGVIHSLSDQISLHQNNFDELKDELTKAKKRQAYLEDTYGSRMRELELLLDNFDLDGDKDKARKGDKAAEKPNISPTAVLECLRRTLMQYKKNLNVTCEELTKMKKHCENLGKECESYKDIVWTKDKALEETQRSYAQTSKELSRMRSEFVECDAQHAAMKVQLQTALNDKDRESANARMMGDEITRLAKRVKDDEEDRLNYLHALYQRVVIGRVVSEPRTSVLGAYNWQDLSSMVQEQVNALINTLSRTEQKVSHLEQVLCSKEEMITQLQEAHDDQLDKLETAAIEREKTWQTQKNELEQHYSRLLSEVHFRSKKSQTLADQAWERVRATGTLQLGLEGECMMLTNTVEKLKQEQNGLLCACALLAGAFFPLYSRFEKMTSQHRLLYEQAEQASSIYGQARVLVDTLNAELEQQNAPRSGKFSPVRSRPSGVVRFRIGVVAVMAANRLTRFRQSMARMFTSYDLSTGLSGLAVWCGGVDTEHVDEKEPTQDNTLQTGQRKALSWLTSDHLRETILNATMDVQDVVAHVGKEGRQVDTKLIVGAARTSFAKLTEKLAAFYPVCPEMTSVVRDKTSLVRQLGNGLARVIMDGGKETKDYFTPPQILMTKLQQHLMDLIQRLHDAEVDKRNLQHEIEYLVQQHDQLRGTAHMALTLESQVNTLKDQTKKMIEVGRFEDVCAELTEALAREQHAQRLLTRQAQQISDVTVKLDSFINDDKENKRTLTDTIQSLSNTKLELRHKDQELRQLNKTLTQLESDNNDLLSNIKDAELALRTTTRDRDTLYQYINNVETAMEKTKRQLGSTRAGLTPEDARSVDTLLAPDLLQLEAGKAGPEAQACHRLVTAFVDAQHQLLARCVSAEEEVMLQRQHIQTLKQELSAACRREYEIDCLTVSGEDVGRYVDMSRARQPTRDGQDRDDFRPLSLDPETPRSLGEDAHTNKVKKSHPVAAKHKSAKSSTKTAADSRRPRPNDN